jgi:hypothetical protein
MSTTSFAVSVAGLTVLLSFPLAAQYSDTDPCGTVDTTTTAFRQAAAMNWGYSFDSLRADLARWSASRFVRVDSIGASVQGRGLFMLTIQDTLPVFDPRTRVWIHARTHPSEVQSTWVTNEMIAFLLSDHPAAKVLRDSCVFNIVPMINPDGVELGRPRQNANGVDLESNWASVPGEPEVQALRAKFIQLMAAENPIRIALNMHSSISCTRYFVFHAASGTSQLFAALQQQYIGMVQSHFPGGIENWNYFVSWVNGAPLVYPESWFWYNHQETVMALTYEDMNCSANGLYDSTARALLFGSRDYLGIAGPTSVSTASTMPVSIRLEQNYPNPFNPTTTIEYALPVDARVTLEVYDVLGRRVAELVNGNMPAGYHAAEFNATNLASGVYFYRLSATGGEGNIFTQMRKLILMK